MLHKCEMRHRYEARDAHVRMPPRSPSTMICLRDAPRDSSRTLMPRHASCRTPCSRQLLRVLLPPVPRFETLIAPYRTPRRTLYRTIYAMRVASRVARVRAYHARREARRDASPRRATRRAAAQARACFSHAYHEPAMTHPWPTEQPETCSTTGRLLPVVGRAGPTAYETAATSCRVTR